MIREHFDNYSFSINTQIKVDGDWHRIKSVDFYKAIIETSKDVFTLNQIQELKD